MNDEQRRVRFFQPQPEGLGLFSHPAALSVTDIEQLNYVSSALLDVKIASSNNKYERATGPNQHPRMLTLFHVYARFPRAIHVYQLQH